MNHLTETHKSLGPRQLAWRRLRRNRIAIVGGSILILLYTLGIFAGFFSPYSPTQDEFRNYFFHPPTPIHFWDEDGKFHWRPYVLKTYLIDRNQLIYSAGTPLYVLYRYPAGNLNRYLPDTIESDSPFLILRQEDDKIVGTVKFLQETSENSGFFSGVIPVDPSAVRVSKSLILETATGDSARIAVTTEKPIPLSQFPSSNLSIQNDEKHSITAYYPQAKRWPIRFFVHSWEYRILWIFKSNLHLFGTERPGRLFLLGTDQSGRDILSRILFGAQISLTVGLVGVLITSFFGMLLGGIAGYYGGNLDNFLMRVAEILISIPALYLILTLRNVIPDRMQDFYDKLAQFSAETFAWQSNRLVFFIIITLLVGIFSYYNIHTGWRRGRILAGLILFGLIVFGPAVTHSILALLQTILPGSTHLTSEWTYLMIILILSLIGWAVMARVIRGLVLSLREQEYVLAARALGESDLRILIRHILPNTFGYVIVRATLLIPAYILGEVALSFLGVGVQEPTPSWGNMLAAAQNLRVLQQFTWTLAPGVFLFLTVLAYNFFGDGLRDALDPKQR